MSGICGLVGEDGSHASGARVDLASMLAALSGYGEASSTWVGEGAELGLRSSPSGKRDRPVALHEDARTGMVVAADVRLDNRRELSDALGIPASVRKELDDAALVLRAFQHWGRECPDRLFGDFAFAVFDPRKRELFCARDALGVRPFYYAVIGRRIVFGTAIEAVLAVRGVPGGIDEAKITPLLMGARFDQNPWGTFFKAVSRLKPGYSMTFADGRPSFQRHWRPERVRESRPASDAAALDEVLDLLSQAVRRRLVGGPVGLEVSGGLDSTVLVALTVRELERQQRPHPIGFSMLPAPNENALRKYHTEYEATTFVADHFGLPLHYEPFAVEHCVQNMCTTPLYPGRGFPRLVPLAAETGVKVLLSGWGGDQGGISHNGFGYRHQLLLRGQLSRFIALSRARGTSPLRSALSVALEVAHPDARVLLDRLRHGRPAEKPGLPINPDFALSARPPRLRRLRTFSVRDAQLQALRGPQMSAAMEGVAAQEATFGLERFFPLLDRRLVEFGLGLPAEYYLRAREDRWLMRRAIAQLVPAYGTRDAGKEDQARSDASFAELLQAVPRVHRILEKRSDPSAASKYVDVPRLLEMLNTQWLRENRRHRHIVRGALSLLYV